MKLILTLIGLIFLLQSCNNISQQEKDIKFLNSMKSPITIVGKAKYGIGEIYCVILKDSSNKLYTISEMPLSNAIGNNYNVGDTLGKSTLKQFK